eukprot:6332168-Prymnesium_polylepis.1
MRRCETSTLPSSGTCSTRDAREEQLVVSGPAKSTSPRDDSSTAPAEESSMLATNGAYSLLISNTSMYVAYTGTSKPTISHSSPVLTSSGAHVS